MVYPDGGSVPTMPLVAAVVAPTISYNASSGILTTTVLKGTGTISADFGLKQNSYTNTVNTNTTKYCCYIE